MIAGSNRNSSSGLTKLTTADKKKIANSFNNFLLKLESLSAEELETIKDEVTIDGEVFKINSASRENALYLARLQKNQKDGKE